MPETEDKPDLDELLELPGAPDEEPRRQRIPGSIWLMLALVLSLAGVWLALRTAMGTAAAKTTGPPVLPTKVSNRTPREQKSGTVDVVEDYLARCKKGMTAQEVRWIVEDFQNAGLDHGPGSLASVYERMKMNPPHEETLESLAIRLGKRQRAWYAEAVQGALKLDSSQRSHLIQNLEKALEEDRGACLALRVQHLQTREAGVDPEWAGIEFSFLARPASWLLSESYRPEKLVELSEAQKQISWFNNWVGESREGEVKPFPASSEVRMVDVAGFRWRNPVGKTSPEGTWFVTQDYLQATAGLASLIALTKDQNYRGGGVVELAKVLHPAQLKVLLLLDPDAADEFLRVLDQVGE